MLTKQSHHQLRIHSSPKLHIGLIAVFQQEDAVLCQLCGTQTRYAFWQAQIRQAAILWEGGEQATQGKEAGVNQGEGAFGGQAQKAKHRSCSHICSCAAPAEVDDQLLSTNNNFYIW